MFKIHSKKGMVDDLLDLILTVIMALFVYFLIFSITIGAQKEADKAIEKSLYLLERDQNLFNQLKTPITIGEKRLPVAEAIALVYQPKKEQVDEQARNKLKTEIGNLRMKKEFWDIHLIWGPRGSFIVPEGPDKEKVYSAPIMRKARLPLPDNNIAEFRTYER